MTVISNSLAVIGAICLVLSLSYVLMRTWYGNNWVLKAGLDFYLGGGFSKAIKIFLENIEVGKIDKENLAQLTAEIIWRITRVALVGVIITLIPLLLLLNQNLLIKEQNKKIDVQNTLFESQRRGFVMNDLLNKIESELQSPNQTDLKHLKLSEYLIGRIAAFSYSIPPYKFYQPQTAELYDIESSPERGQLLLALANANLDSSTLYSIYYRTQFSNSFLLNVNLKDVNLEGVMLSNSILRKANFTNSNLSKADLSGSDLSGATLGKLDEALVPLVPLHAGGGIPDLSTEISIPNCTTLSASGGEDFSNFFAPEDSLLHQSFGTNMTNTSLYNTNLWRSRIYETDLSESQAISANYSESAICKSLFDRSYQHESNFSDAILTDVSFRYADLTFTNFERVQCEKVDFFKADILGAKFSNVDFKGILNLTLEQLLSVGTLYNSTNIDSEMIKRIMSEKPCLFSKSGCF